MPRKLPPLDLDNLYRRYQSGAAMEHLAQDAGIGLTTLYRLLKQAGLPVSRVKHPGAAALRDLYITQQLSCATIAARYGVHEGTVAAWLGRAGLRRSMSETKRLEMGRLAPDERRARAAAAHAAVRGMTRTEDDLHRRALGKERTKAHQSEVERRLLSMIPEKACAAPCMAIGPYNVDIALDAVTVEVFGGGWHGGGRAAARWPKRVRYLLDHGWSVVVVWVEHPRYPLTVTAAEYVVALSEQTRWHPTAPSEYRVIRGTGEEIILGCAQDDHFPVKPARGSRVPVRCDHLNEAGQAIWVS